MTNTTVVNDKIEMDAQILFSHGAGLFCGCIVKESEKAVKVDYGVESIWSNGPVIYRYTTWIPKSVIINDEIGGLTVKPWFAKSGLKKDTTFHIKQYMTKDGKKIFC